MKKKIQPPTNNSLFHLLILFLTLYGKMQAQQFVSLSAKPIGSEEILLNCEAEQLDSNFEAARSFLLNPELQQKNQLLVGQPIFLDLFPEYQFTGQITDLTTDINETQVYSISFDDFPFSRGFIATDSRGVSALRISIPEMNKIFQMYYHSKTGQSYLTRMDTEERSSDINSVSIFSDDSKSGIKTTAITGTGTGTENVVHIDLMVIYTYNAEMWFNNKGGINNNLALMLSDFQSILNNSDTGLIFNLVFSGPVGFWETNSSSSDFAALRNPNDGLMDEVHQWRKSYRADMVTLITVNDDTLGISSVLRQLPGNPINGFNLVNVGGIVFGTYTQTFGHILGCHNHKENAYNPGPGLFEYSAGWRFLGNGNKMYSTVMSNTSGYPDGRTSTTIPYFSNPSVFYQSKPVGDPQDGDNARTIRESKSYVAAYSDLLQTEDLVHQAVSVIPNPTSGEITITGASGLSTVKIYDELGRLILTTSSPHLDMSSYNKGLYFLKINTDTGISTVKIIKD